MFKDESLLEIQAAHTVHANTKVLPYPSMFVQNMLLIGSAYAVAWKLAALEDTALHGWPARRTTHFQSMDLGDALSGLLEREEKR